MPYRVRVEFSGMQGAPWLATHVFQEGAGSAAQAVAAVGTFWGAVDATMDNEVNWTTLTDVESFDAATGNVTAVTSVTAVTGSGALALEALPLASQGLVRWRTGVYVSGREIRGRTFIPGLADSANDNGNLAASVATTIGNAANALIADANSQLEIWSRVNGATADVTSASVWSSFAVLRSRRD